jgi:hypothetical protein
MEIKELYIIKPFPDMKKSKTKLFEIYGKDIPNDVITNCDNFKINDKFITPKTIDGIIYMIVLLYYHYINETIDNEENICEYINICINNFNVLTKKTKIVKINSIIGNDHIEKSKYLRKILNNICFVMKK